MQMSLAVLDTSVLVNFLRIARLDLLRRHPLDFIVTDHVVSEITDHYTDQKRQLRNSLHDGTLQQMTIKSTDELKLFASLIATRTLGGGECSAIALAVHRDYVLAMDDRRAIKHAHSINQNLKVITTPDLLQSMIDQKLLNQNEATAIKDQWARKHRFIIKDSGDGLHRFIRRNWISRYGRNPCYWLPVRPLVLVDELHLAPVTEDQLESLDFVVDDVGYGPASANRMWEAMIQAVMDEA